MNSNTNKNKPTPPNNNDNSATINMNTNIKTTAPESVASAADSNPNVACVAAHHTNNITDTKTPESVACAAVDSTPIVACAAPTHTKPVSPKKGIQKSSASGNRSGNIILRKRVVDIAAPSGSSTTKKQSNDVLHRQYIRSKKALADRAGRWSAKAKNWQGASGTVPATSTALEAVKPTPQQEAKAAFVGSKRPRSEDKPTAPNAKKADFSKKSFSDILKGDLNVAITKEDQSDGPISMEQFKLIKKRIMNEILDSSDDEFFPTMETSGLIKGSYRIVCVNEGTKTWLETKVPLWTDLWDNCRLRVTDTRLLPTPKKVCTFISGDDEVDDASMLKVLRKQNPRLMVDKWSILRKHEVAGGIDRRGKQVSSGTFYVLAIDDPSYDLLLGELKNNMYFCASTIKVGHYGPKHTTGDVANAPPTALDELAEELREAQLLESDEDESDAKPQH